MSIRVLQIIPTLVRGGAEKQLTLLACGLPRDRFDVHVAVLTHDGPYHQMLDEHSIPVTIVGKKRKLDLGAFSRLKQTIRSLRPDIVHTWIFAANCYGRAAAFAEGVRHVVAGERCVDPWKGWHQFALDRWLARRTSRLVTNSTGVRDFYVQHGLPAEKFVVIPNGIAPAPESPGISREALLREFQLPESAKLVGAVGRLWAQKRYKDLIWAAELLNAGRGDTYFLIVGDGPLREELENYMHDIRAHEHVRFLGERSDVAQILSHLDCFWLASGYEGQSNGLMEAMAAGVPVVATDIAGNRDLVVPDETGFLLPVGDAGQFARQTHLLLEDRELARRFGEQGRRRMVEEFSIEKMIDRHCELYNQLAGT